MHSPEGRLPRAILFWFSTTHDHVGSSVRFRLFPASKECSAQGKRAGNGDKWRGWRSQAMKLRWQVGDLGHPHSSTSFVYLIPNERVGTRCLSLPIAVRG